MSANERRRDRARLAARRLVASIGTDVRQTRLSLGLSIASAANAVGFHPSTFGRLERNELAHVAVDHLALACAAVGHQLSIRSYPADDPARDAGQLRLLARFRARLPATAGWRTEVPLPIAGDRRAIDGMVELTGSRIGVEAESRLGDLQAIDRRVQLKKRREVGSAHPARRRHPRQPSSSGAASRSASSQLSTRYEGSPGCARSRRVATGGWHRHLVRSGARTTHRVSGLAEMGRVLRRLTRLVSGRTKVGLHLRRFARSVSDSTKRAIQVRQLARGVNDAAPNGHAISSRELPPTGRSRNPRDRGPRRIGPGRVRRSAAS
jgi:transcriptional regulator with XRE-family HTH domain